MLYYAFNGLPIIFLTLTLVNIQLQIFSNFGVGKYYERKYGIPDFRQWILRFRIIFNSIVNILTLILVNIEGIPNSDISEYKYSELLC